MKKAATHLIAALALGGAGMAFAQGTPPTTAPANPALGAGQQNQTGTPMGTTGVLPQQSQSNANAQRAGDSTVNRSMPDRSASERAADRTMPDRMDSDATRERVRTARADRN